MNTPKPIESSLVLNSGWVIISSRSIRVSTTPATNEPRITSRPRLVASAVSPIKSRKAPRIRIWAVVSWRRRSVSRILRECSTPAIVNATSTAATNSRLIRMIWFAVPADSREKKSDSRITVAKSAIVAPATTSCPNVEEISPESFSTGTTTPSEVDDKTIAMKRGWLTQPAFFRTRPATIAITNDTTKPRAAIFKTRPRSFSNSISSPARKSRKARPTIERTRTGSSTWTHPSTAGPITIPATSSRTTDGIRTAGASPSRSGAAKPTATTIRRFVNCGSTATPPWAPLWPTR